MHPLAFCARVTMDPRRAMVGLKERRAFHLAPTKGARTPAPWRLPREGPPAPAFTEAVCMINAAFATANVRVMSMKWCT